ncbi:type II toxin-antitoxin system HipA family toxin [Caulobacter sp. 602-1]|uniref:type II toxin-antitoxin system HipA family toxin n=1 Tax=Caulobacter sp. 602-1 TaxID=2492472 RepID=UPI000F63142D|nr:type II toxin-antitoxin system HipA family toxin [Caulobacter sp. 602-1]RRN64266.1 type II toxin-antitoxin system HipA family toxin [Caulobacter sp. 602-1]
MSDPMGLVVRMDGFALPAGYLASDANHAISFAYDDRYVAAGGPPLSLSMPVEQVDFGDVATRAFFDNLLPENDQMQRVMDREGLARDDIVGLLSHLGADCSGAISCLPVGADPIKVPGVLAEDYELLSPEAVAAIVHSLAEKQRLPDAVRDPSPVAGVQRKIALTHTAQGFATPKAGKKVPTTHILKVPETRLGRDARLEEAAAHLAQSVGLEVSVPKALVIDGVEVLLIERFDRVVRDGVVYRLHQEDFAQALGLPATLKYQRNGGAGRVFDSAAIATLLKQTTAPALAREAFLSATIFNLLIGNTDNHAKNHGLIYRHGGAPSLAPLYDLLPSRMNLDFNDQLAFNIGGADHPDKITANDLLAFFATFGFSRGAALRFIDRVAVPMITALERASLDLPRQRLKDFDDLIGRETEQLVETLGLNLKIRERDYYPKTRHALAAS